MAMACALIKANFAQYKHHISMVVVQICFAIMYFITEAAFNEGLNPSVFVTYRYILAGLLILPCAYFLERKSRPKMTLAMFLKLLLASLIGIAFNSNMLNTSMKYTSPTFVAAVYNTVSALTFVMAILLRMEVVDAKSCHGIAKILGTIISLAGVTTITLYKGPGLQSLWDAPIHMKRVANVHENWVLGSILIIASCIAMSSWYIMQAAISKEYPAQLSLTAFVDSFGGAQSAIFAVFLQHKSSAWYIKMFGIKFWAITFSAIIGSGLIIFLQMWSLKEKGPVFTAMFNPLQTVLVAVLAYFVFGEKLYTGSIIGGIIVIIGLYLLLWGKEKDEIYMIKAKEQSCSHYDGPKVTLSEGVLASGESDQVPQVKHQSASESDSVV